MSKFKMILFGGTKENMGAVAAAKLEFTRRLLFTGFVLILACFAGFSYISKAWFASNKDVGAENASVTSESGTPNLFIRLKSDPSASFYSLVRTDWSAADGNKGLYTISTANCANWYYINDWAMVLTENKETGITTGEYYASEYAPVTFNSDKDGCYKLTFSENDVREYRAYYCGKYNLYSDKEALDVYLNPENPIVINLGKDTDTPEDAAKNQGLMDAIRVAVVENIDENTNRLVFVYAPVAETGTGKNYITYDPDTDTGTKAAADTFYAVTDTNTATKQTEILFPTTDESGNVTDDGLAAYKGGTVTGDPHSFTKGEKAICQADVNGADVSVYIWLEGMDAQSIINVADNRTIGVNLNFVGVPVAPAQANGEG